MKERRPPQEMNNMLHDFASVAFGIIVGAALHSASLPIKIVVIVCALIIIIDRIRSE